MYKRFLLLLVIFSVFVYSGPSINIDLSKTKYTSGENLGGLINITLDSAIDSDSYIEVKVGDNEKRMNFTNILDYLGKTYQTSIDTAQGKNPSTSKTITNSNYFGIQLPNYAEITSLNLYVSSENIIAPRLDVGDDGEIEWRYVGNFLDWDTADIVSPNMGYTVINANIDDNSKAFCEIVNLPMSKYFQIHADYKKIQDGDSLKAKISSFTSYGGNVEITGNFECDLPAGTGEFGWHSCDIQSNIELAGDYLLCVYSTNAVEETYYQLRADNSGASSGYTCPIDTGLCSDPGGVDYFIKARKGNYVEVLNDSYLISEQGVGFITLNMQEHLGSPACLTEDNVCVVPIKFTANNNNNFEIESLNLEYKDNAGSTYNYNLLYDITYTSPQIIKIEEFVLSSNETTIVVPLSLFNVSIPSVTEEEKVYVTVKLEPGTTRKKSVLVTQGKEGSETDILNMIDLNEHKINEIKTQHPTLIEVLKINDHIQKYNEYKSEVTKISSESISESEKENKFNMLMNTVDSYTSGVVKEIELVSTFSDLQIVEPSDITTNITDKEVSYVYSLQNKVETKINVRTYNVEFNSGSSETYTTIEKEFLPKEDIKSIYVYEIIPKNAANNVNDIVFNRKDFEVVNADPIVRFYFPNLVSGKTVKLSYVLETAPSSGVIYSLKSVLVPREEQDISEVYDYECGDGICSTPYENDDTCPEDCGRETKFPWIYFVIGIVLIVAGIIYLNFYHGKGSILDVRHRKTPFSNKSDLIGVKNFINQSLSKGMDKKEVSKSLIAKGWTKKQIFFAFEDVEWDKRRAFTLSVAPSSGEKDMKNLSDYIKKCLKMYIKEDKIRAALYSKGWTEKEVNVGFSKL